MIYILKHRKSGKYVRALIGKVYTNHGFIRWSGDKTNIKFHLTSDMLSAQQIEDPDMNAVIEWGLEAVPLKLTKAIIEPAYRIFEHE